MQHQPFDASAMAAQYRRTLENQASAIALEQALFAHRSRYLVLILTLGYRPEVQPYMTLDALRQDRRALLNARYRNPILSGIRGYIWKLEQGTIGNNLHMHMVIFYDGQSWQDVNLARYIGEHWCQIATQGRGSYWSSNGDKQRQAGTSWGDVTGKIDRTDLAKRGNLCSYLTGYICKEEQTVVDRGGRYVRLFGTSQHPE